MFKDTRIVEYRGSIQLQDVTGRILMEEFQKPRRTVCFAARCFRYIRRRGGTIEPMAPEVLSWPDVLEDWDKISFPFYTCNSYADVSIRSSVESFYYVPAESEDPSDSIKVTHNRRTGQFILEMRDSNQVVRVSDFLSASDAIQYVSSYLRSTRLRRLLT